MKSYSIRAELEHGQSGDELGPFWARSPEGAVRALAREAGLRGPKGGVRPAVEVVAWGGWADGRVRVRCSAADGPRFYRVTLVEDPLMDCLLDGAVT